jgi:outer membrane protein W
MGQLKINNMKKLFCGFLILLILIPAIALPQQNQPGKIKLKDMHGIGLNFGVINNVFEATVDVNNVSTKMNFQASLSYNYWFSNELAVEINAGFMSASVNSDVTAGGIEQTAAAVFPYFLGVKYMPEFLAAEDNIRPFALLLLGGVTGTYTENVINYTTVSSSVGSETVFSFRGGIGADALISKLLRFGLTVDYLYMPDFKKSIGTRNNYSGINLSMCFGLML